MIVVVITLELLLRNDANAIDGNYSSPYASQYDTRSVGATIPNATLLGGLLLTLNVCIVAFFVVRDRLRRRRKAA